MLKQNSPIKDRGLCTEVSVIWRVHCICLCLQFLMVIDIHPVKLKLKEGPAVVLVVATELYAESAE